MGRRTILETIVVPLVVLIQTLRRTLQEVPFISRHRVRAEEFTRPRQLTFPRVMLFVLQKTVKSIQRPLHEFLDELAEGPWCEPVTAGAWTQARAQLRPTAFIELNEPVVLPAVSQKSERKRWRGHRLFGPDSS